MKIDPIMLVKAFSKAIDEAISENIDSLRLKGVLYGYPKLHQFKIAHFSVHLGHEIGLSKAEIEDLFILGLFHDVGFVSSEVFPSENSLSVIAEYEALVSHCIVGEKLVGFIDFNTAVKNVITFHHEKYDGTGFFKIKGEDIPLFSRIIAFGDIIDLYYNFDKLESKYSSIVDYIMNESGKTLDPNLVKQALKVLNDHQNMDFTKQCDLIPFQEIEYDWKQLITLTSSFMKIIDSKSAYTYKHSNTITKYVDLLSDLYKFDEDRKNKLHIAANLHDVGKLYLPMTSIEKPMRLLPEEYERVKQHSTKGFLMLNGIPEFKDISIWIYQHHEKLDKSGYPLGLGKEEITFEAQILAVCDVFTALREKRPYRDALSVEAAIEVMDQMIANNELNKQIYDDLLGIIKI